MDVGKIIGKLVGNKADRDLRELSPLVDKIKEAYETIKGLSNDQLRERSTELKKKVADHVAPDKSTLAELKVKAEDPDVDVTEKEAFLKDLHKEDLLY